MKNLIKSFNSTLDQTEERISELENTLFEIIQSEEQKVKRMKGKKCLGFVRRHPKR